MNIIKFFFVSAVVIILFCLQNAVLAQIPSNAEPFQKLFFIAAGGNGQATFKVPNGKRLVITNASAQGMYKKQAFCPLAQCTQPSQWILKDFYVNFYIATIFKGEEGTQVLTSMISGNVPELPAGVAPGMDPVASQYVLGSQPVLLFADSNSTVKLGVSRRSGDPVGWTNFFISGYYLKQTEDIKRTAVKKR